MGGADTTLAPEVAVVTGGFSLASRLALEIVASHADSLPLSAHKLDTLGGRITSTGVAVVTVGVQRSQPSLVVKLPVTTAAAAVLEREASVLMTLHGEPRLGSWRRLLPRPYAYGRLDGMPYRIDSFLPGSSGLGQVADDPGRRELLVRAADAIAHLHKSTASTVTVDAELLDRWVDTHIRQLAKCRPRREASTRRLERLRAELYEELPGRRMSVGWIHGDYWLGNLLVSCPEAAASVVDGIVDWETAAAMELPLHDLLHLVLFTRRLRTGRELGHVIVDQLRRPNWSAEERFLLERHRAASQADELSERHALMLYWLRHLGMHLRQQSAALQWRSRYWRHRNVSPVLGVLWP